MDPEIHASLQPAAVAQGGTTTVKLTLTHRGSGSLFVPHPTLSTGALTLRVRLPSGEVRVLGGTPSFGGVPPRAVNAQLQPDKPQTFEIDLGARLPLVAPGSYGVTVEYALPQGGPWRSPELAFTVH